METRTIPDTDVKLSAVGFGVWTVATSWWGIHERETGIELLRRALDKGITYFDTADTYSDKAGNSGVAETILAEAFPNRRDSITIGTKFGYDIYNSAPNPNQRERPQNWTPAFLRIAVEGSLQRLRTDRIDFYQMHNPRIEALQRDDLMAELEALKREGKIRSYGATLGPAIDIRQSEEARYCIEETAMDGVQIIYNLLEQQVGAPIFESARQRGVGILTRVPHASDLLLGQIDENTEFAPGDHRNWRMTTDERKRLWRDRGIKKVAKLEFLTANRERTLGQAAIQFILSEPSIVSVLPNIYDAAMVDELAAASDVPPLTKDEIAQIANLYANDFYLEPDGAATK